MFIQEFINKTGFTDRDAISANKMYKGQDKTEQEWCEILKPDFEFSKINLDVKESKKEKK